MRVHHHGLIGLVKFFFVDAELFENLLLHFDSDLFAGLEGLPDEGGVFDPILVLEVLAARDPNVCPHCLGLLAGCTVNEL